MSDDLLPFCECGCGERVSKPGNRFIHGHHARRKLSQKEIEKRTKARIENKLKPIPEALPCKCGCGELAKPGNRFINGHSPRGRKRSVAHCKAISEARKEYYINNPNAGNEHSKFMKEYWDIQANRDALSKIKKQFYIDNPEALKAMSKRRIQYNDDHPEFLERNSEMWREYWAIQANRDALSEIMKNSDACKAEHERQFGGQDIVEHHYIYDHSDLSKYTTKMTRSAHARLHNNMRKTGIKVPHINVEVNEND